MRTFVFISAATFGLLGIWGMVGCQNRAPNTLLSEMPKAGAAFTLEIDSDPATDNTNRLAELKEAMILRFSKFGTQFFWDTLSETRVRVVTPAAGRNSFEAVKGFIAHAGRLEFRLVHPNSDQLTRDGLIPHGYEVVERDLNPPMPTELPPGTIMSLVIPGSSTNHIEKILVKKPDPDLAGELIEKVKIGSDPLGNKNISITLKSTAAAAMAKLTREHVGGRLAMMLDGQLYSAPTIHAPIESGNITISGGLALQNPDELYLILTCPYPVSVKLLEVKML